jgi:predicted AAA+ superfamily ATPase
MPANSANSDLLTVTKWAATKTERLGRTALDFADFYITRHIG